MSLLLSAGAVVTDGAVLRPGWVEVEAGLVVRVGRGAPPRPADVVAPEGVVVPGFVDIHVHGGGGTSFTSGSRDEALAALAAHRAHGTTTSMASLVSARPAELLSQVSVLADLVEEGQAAGIHLEGPWLARKRCGAHDPDALRAPEPDEVRALLEAGRGTVRMVTIAPELPGALETIRSAVDHGVVMAVGHTQATYDETRAAIDAGATVATHLFNAMRPINHREPGPVTALMEDPRVMVEVILDGVHLHPAIYGQVLDCVAPSRVALVTDAMGAAGMPDGEYALGALPVTVAGRVARVSGSDTIAGSTATTDLLFREAARLGPSGPDEALLSAVEQTSVAPARAVGLPVGRLAVGDPADLVVLDRLLAPTSVMRGGAWVTEAAELPA